MSNLHLRRLGKPAAELLHNFEHGTAFAVFKRSFYVRFGPERIICIGRDDLPLGPLMALCSGWPSSAELPREGSGLRRKGNFLRFEDSSLLIRTGEALTWEPQPTPPPDPEGLRAALAALALEGAPLYPREGFGALIPALLQETVAEYASAAGPGDLLLREAARAFAALRVWLCGDAAALDHCERAVRILIGLGPGLTPSGDDALGGALIALRMLEKEEHCSILGHMVMRHVCSTNEISQAHIQAAIKGTGAEPLHEVLRLLCGGSSNLTASLRALDRMGHSSGWDALAGATAVLACQPR